MSVKKVKNLDYKSLTSGSKENGAASPHQTLKPSSAPLKKEEAEILQTLENPVRKTEKPELPIESPQQQQQPPLPPPAETNNVRAEKEIFEKEVSAGENPDRAEPSYAEQQKQIKKQKTVEKDARLLSGDRWLARNGHTLTYVGVFLFTLVLYFRPYELIPALSGFSSVALILAIATILIYLPTQFSTEGTLTTLSTEIKCILFLVFWALLTVPIAKDRVLAWETFNDTFIKVILIFIVMVNTLRTKSRMKGLMWLAIGVGVMLSYQAVELYQQGSFKDAGFRAQVDFGGMFGNPNDMALHLVVFMPIAFALGIASKNKLSKLVYFVSAGMMVAGILVTQSRGGFLGMVGVGAVLAWKLGKKQRVKVTLLSIVSGVLVLAFAPGNYGLRVLSIFVPALDQSGSSDQRSELLKKSIIVSLRNPQGIGIGNFPIVSIQNLQTHNAYTQVSSELGLLALVAYVILMVSPVRKLAAIERQMFDRKDFSWMYYLSIGVQASIIGYMVSSFFAAVAYNWYVYYPIAFAVCLRRIYQTSLTGKAEQPAGENDLSGYFDRREASV